VRLRPVPLALSAGLAALLAALALSAPARATIVERVVAVVGERPILWTELLRRAKSGRVQIRMQTQDANVIGVQEQEMYKELLDRMIDDRMEEQQADRAHITVPPDEIDRGIANIAAQAQAQQGRTVASADIMEEVARRGMTEQDFRDEIRRQILEGKLIELRVRPRVHVTEQEGRNAYQHYVQQMTDQETMEVRILAKRLSPDLTKAQRNAKLALVQELVQRARAGEDFCKLVSQYSDDVSTRSTCGSRGAQPLGALVPQIREIVRATKTGTYSDPVSIVMGQEEVVLIVMPLGEAKVPVYEDVKSDMMQRALMDGLEVARKQWLQELRRNVYVDVRL
jgi:peptidyl-prolyl cis-trans isomerase SurA